MTLFHTCCETLHRSGGVRMKVDERTVVGGGLIGHCASPQPWREIDAHGQISDMGYVKSNQNEDKPMVLAS